MKILEVAGSGTIFSDDMGPVSSVLFNLSKYFSEFGHEVTVIDTKSSLKRKIPEKIDFIEVKGIPRAFFNEKNFFKAEIKSWKNEYMFIRSLGRHIEIDNYEVIHFHEVLPTFIYLLFDKFDKKKPNVVYTSHTPNWANPSIEDLTLRGKLGRFNRSYLEKSVIRKSDLTIALGTFLKKKIPDANIKVIPNGVDIAEYTKIEKSKAREEMKIDKDDFVIVFVGRITPIKGVDILINAAKKVKETTPNLKVYLVGSLGGNFQIRNNITPYAQKMLNISDNCCEFPGFISNKIKNLLLNSVDIFVLPSRFDNCPLTILEAMARGKPVIASNIGGIPDIVKDGINGYLFEVGNERDLANKIIMLYNNENLRKEMGINSRKLVEDKYTWKKVSKRYLEVFEGLRGKITQNNF